MGRRGDEKGAQFEGTQSFFRQTPRRPGHKIQQVQSIVPALRLRDYARIELSNPGREVYVIEANPIVTGAKE